jgi:hypothetical protein
MLGRSDWSLCTFRTYSRPWYGRECNMSNADNANISDRTAATTTDLRWTQPRHRCSQWIRWYICISFEYSEFQLRNHTNELHSNPIPQSQPLFLGMEPTTDRTLPNEFLDLENNHQNATATKHEPDSDSESCPRDNKSSSLVSWEGPNDKANPKNWSVARRLAITTTVALCTFTTTFGSSAMAPATYVLAQKYGVSPTVILLSVALYVFGFATGMDFYQQCILSIVADVAIRSSPLGPVVRIHRS